MKMTDVLPKTRPQVGGFIIAIIISAVITKYIIDPLLPDLKKSEEKNNYQQEK